MIEDINIWFIEHPFSTNIIKYLAWILLVFILISWIRRVLKRNLPSNTAKYKTQKVVEIIGYILVALVSITYFTGSI